MTASLPNSALGRAFSAAQARYEDTRATSHARLEQARAVMPGGNTRSSLWSGPFPLCIASGEGCRLTDVDGHSFVDFLGEFTAGIFGHSSPLLAQAVAEAHAKGISLSSHSEAEIGLAERLVARFPSMELLRFCNSGTEANLMAVALAKAVTGRGRIVVFDGGYHGGLMSFGGGGSPVNAPHDWLVLPYNDVAALEAAFEGGPGIAALVVEPMLGAGGCIPATRAFLEAARRLTAEAGAVLIFDEVQTARMALGGMQDRLGITPDLTVIGKFFGGGLAFGAFGGRRDLMARFDPAQPGALPHAGTFNNNTLTMSAGIAACDHLLTGEALEALFDRGEAFRTALSELFTRHAAPYRVSGLGSIMNIHGVSPQPERAEMLRRLLQFEMLEAGYYFAARGLIALSLPLGQEETQGFLAAAEAFLLRHRDMLTEEA